MKQPTNLFPVRRFRIIRRLSQLILFLLVLFTGCVKSTSDFTAYYTNFCDKDEITGDFADVVIRFTNEMEFVFCRDSDYLPFLKHGSNRWYVQEIIERDSIDGAHKQLKFNKYSYVRIIKNQDDEIIVHWRYIPDYNNLSFSSVVHEYYSIKANGKISRTIQPGTNKLDDFNDPNNWFIEELKLTSSGIKSLSLTEPHLSEKKIPPITGSTISNKTIENPLIWWTFDDALAGRSSAYKDITVEKISGINCTIYGNQSLWKKGISGSSLAFDGYHTAVIMPGVNPPENVNPFTIEAWIALGAYPWKEGAILDISQDSGGIYFGITDIGQLLLRLNGINKQHTIISNEEIDLNTWTHVAATYNLDKNEARIYINGKDAGFIVIGNDKLNLVQTDISIGLNKIPKKTTEHVSRDYPPHIRTPKGNQPMIYGIEGLIDEVKIYGSLLSSANINESYNLLNVEKSLIQNPDLEPRILPGEVNGKKAEKFGAYYTSLKYHDLWDNLWRSSSWPDIVVKFDELPCTVVYWRGTNYGPGWVTENNIWMSDQSSEIGTSYGCSEHMADKQNRYSHVRILENTDARVVVHWRYASADIIYEFSNWRTWTDEYHYIYPDGTAIRYVNYRDGLSGWQDVQFLAAAGSTQEDNINLQALTVANLKGESYKLDWTNGVPKNELKDASISVVNFKSEYKVMVIYPDGQKIGTWGKRERATPETYFAGPWNHWPVSQMPNDGRYAMRTDRLSSSALGGASPDRMTIYGFTNKDITTLVPLAKFWNNPPEISIESGAENSVYEKSQKAYLLKATDNEILLTIKASKEFPIYNPCFVVSGLDDRKFSLYINGENIKQNSSFRYGYVSTANGFNLIIWLNIQSEKTVKMKISGHL